MARTGVFPGSFDPLTVAHLAIADAARAQCGLGRLTLVMSHRPLAKDHRGQTAIEERVAVLERRLSDRPWLDVRATEHTLLVDIAAGADVLVLGADKWHQLHDPAFYGDSTDAMRRALDRLPAVAVAPRAGHALPDTDQVTILTVAEHHHDVSSSAVRAGRTDWLA